MSRLRQLSSHFHVSFGASQNNPGWVHTECVMHHVLAQIMFSSRHPGCAIECVFHGYRPKRYTPSHVIHMYKHATPDAPFDDEATLGFPSALMKRVHIQSNDCHVRSVSRTQGKILVLASATSEVMCGFWFCLLCRQKKTVPCPTHQILDLPKTTVAQQRNRQKGATQLPRKMDSLCQQQGLSAKGSPV